MLKASDSRCGLKTGGGHPVLTGYYLQAGVSAVALPLYSNNLGDTTSRAHGPEPTPIVSSSIKRYCVFPG